MEGEIVKKRVVKRNLRNYIIAAVCVVAAAAGMTGGVAARRIQDQQAEEQARTGQAGEETKTADATDDAKGTGETDDAADTAVDSAGHAAESTADAAAGSTGQTAENAAGSAGHAAENAADASSDSAGQTAADAASGKTIQASAEQKEQQLAEADTGGREQAADLSENTAAEEPEEETVETAGSVQTSETAAEENVRFSFTENQTLVWPVNGNVILDYDMEHMVYFATLDQYKYNPAVLIQADVNEKINAAASGIVVDVSTNEETGQTVCMDIGGGYQLTYGQLKEPEYAVGDTVEQGAVIGYVSEPTKYYVSEGSHLYFSMTKDGEAQDPLDYLGSE